MAGTLTYIQDGGTALAGDSAPLSAQSAINNLTNVSAATNEFVLTKDTGTGNAIWKATPGGGGTPASPDTSVQFNDGGSFGGDSHFVWDKMTHTLTLDNLTFNYNSFVNIAINNPIVADTDG